MNQIKPEELAAIFRGAEANLKRSRTYVDSLNVFPVPDGDTGTNMTLTIQSAVKEMNDAEEEGTMPSLASAIARGALKGARGNSGVILSQILKGFSLVAEKETALTTALFARGLKNGANVAYDVVTHPKEGTILTVIRLMGEYAVKIAGRKKEFEEFFPLILKKGEEVLASTPEMLPVLKKAGVVDAGGKGLLILLEGMYNALIGVEMPAPAEGAEDALVQDVAKFEFADVHDLEHIKFAYCTEYFIINLHKKTTVSDIDKLRDNLSAIGDCVLVVGDLQMVKVHVHTNHPDKALGYALRLGELGKLKVENMLEQNREFKKQSEKARRTKPMGMVSISTGSGLKSIFTDLTVDVVLEGGQTMNPSVDDIVKAVNSVNAETVFILPNNSNIILTAEQAKELAQPNLVVIATKDIPSGISAAIAFNPDVSVEENEEAMQRAANGVRVGQVTHAVRSAEIDGFELKEGDVIGIYKNIVAKGADVSGVALETVRTMVDDETSAISLYYGEGVAGEDAEALAERMRGEFAFHDVMVYGGGQQHYYYYLSVE